MRSSHKMRFSDDPVFFSAGSFHFSNSVPEIRSQGPRQPMLTWALQEVSVLSRPHQAFQLECCAIGLHVMFLLAHGVTFVQTGEALWFWGSSKEFE